MLQPPPTFKINFENMYMRCNSEIHKTDSLKFPLNNFITWAWESSEKVCLKQKLNSQDQQHADHEDEEEAGDGVLRGDDCDGRDLDDQLDRYWPRESHWLSKVRTRVALDFVTILNKI